MYLIWTKKNIFGLDGFSAEALFYELKIGYLSFSGVSMEIGIDLDSEQ